MSMHQGNDSNNDISLLLMHHTDDLYTTAPMCKNDIIPLQTRWGYVFFAITHRYLVTASCWWLTPTSLVNASCWFFPSLIFLFISDMYLLVFCLNSSTSFCTMSRSPCNSILKSGKVKGCFIYRHKKVKSKSNIIWVPLSVCFNTTRLTHWGWDKIAAIWKRPLSNIFSWIKIIAV